MAGHVGKASVMACTVGIGLPAAAVGATARVVDARPRTVVLIGTCGAYRGTGLAIGDVVVARRCMVVDGSVLTGEAQFPEAMSRQTASDEPMVRALVAAGARAADVATTLAVTVDDSAADRIARTTGAHVEHLEALGIAVACAACATPFAAVLGVANIVGKDAREEWRKNHVEAAAAAVGCAVRWLEACWR